MAVKELNGKHLKAGSLTTAFFLILGFIFWACIMYPEQIGAVALAVVNAALLVGQIIVFIGAIALCFAVIGLVYVIFYGILERYEIYVNQREFTRRYPPTSNSYQRN